ncbi:sulfotransferase [Psychromonas sp. GE-S-Ul-11]|uniref:sulfotransferase n=1 Tax=Psychromonas sp. GE-S-Ul-11 TaxID=3241170 RepID=UPI00390C749C
MNTKIFQIGFNKCGTLSIHDFLVANGIRSVHYMKGQLANTIFKNYDNGDDLLKGLDDYDAFSDMESLTPDGFQYVANDLFKVLHRSYPDAVFILNTRPVDDWINSRLRHGGGSYLDRYRCILDKPKADIIEVWHKQYHQHVTNVLSYFSEYPDAHFIHLDLASCQPDDLGHFLQKAGVPLTQLSLPHAHKSPGKKLPEKKQQLSKLLDAAWYFKGDESDISQSLLLAALKVDPTNIYVKYELNNKKLSLVKGWSRKMKFIFGDNQ